MRILIIGSGGREDAFAWAVAKSPRCEKLYIAPGNPGTARYGENVPIDTGSHESLIRFATENEVDLIVVGPEQPLVDGFVDRCGEAGLRVVGPSGAAARLEGSKSFSKAFMVRHGIPTAGYRTFTAGEAEAAYEHIRREGAPIVVKASGLAAGKGAVVCVTVQEATAAARQMLEDGAFGEAGSEIVVESYMEGEEASVFALCDGSDYVLLPSAQDHKRVGDGDHGPNTGGMGAYAPAPIVTKAVLARVRSEIIEPVLQGMAAEGHPYRGFLYVGLMITGAGPRVVEFNCRLGDPEAQVVLPLLETDIVDLLEASVEGKLEGAEVAFKSASAACVVLASGGYPGSYRKGLPVTGLEAAEDLPQTLVFHAGTAVEDGKVVTSGGRVIGVTGLGGNLQEAIHRAYTAANVIDFEYRHFRTDIGEKGLRRVGGA